MELTQLHTPLPPVVGTCTMNTKIKVPTGENWEVSNIPSVIPVVSQNVAFACLSTAFLVHSTPFFPPILFQCKSDSTKVMHVMNSVHTDRETNKHTHTHTVVCRRLALAADLNIPSCWNGKVTKYFINLLYGKAGFVNATLKLHCYLTSHSRL